MQDQKRVSVKDIASRLNVSLSTVHKALTGKPGISRARREEVIRIAEEMGYVVNAVAQSLSRHNMTIGVIMPDIWQEYFAKMKEGIEAQLLSMREYRVNGVWYRIGSALTSEAEERIREWICENGINAVLYCASHYTMNNAVARALEGVECPVFWVGGDTRSPLSVTCVTVDAEYTGRLAADFLGCMARPKASAAVFTGSMKNEIHRTKTVAFCRRIEENGGEVLAICETNDDPEKAYAAMEMLLREHPDVNAVYVSTSTSEPVCRYMEEYGLAGKVALLGSDVFHAVHIYMARGVMQAAISQNQAEVGRLAAAYAYEYLNRTSSYGNADWKPEPLIMVKPSLLLRTDIEQEMQKQ